MVGHETDIQELRTRLQASRWRMHDTIQRLEDQIYVSQRIKNGVASHPLRWVALAMGVGLVTGAMGPWIMRLTDYKMIRKLPGLAFRIALIAALPAWKMHAFPETPRFE